MATVPQLTLIARRPKTRKPSRLSSKIPAVARERRATNRLMAEVIGADVGRLRWRIAGSRPQRVGSDRRRGNRERPRRTAHARFYGGRGYGGISGYRALAIVKRRQRTRVALHATW